MATVTKPMALDESLNTTEATPRNIADVLAEELSGIASALTPAQLASLADVTISSPSDGQTLKYDAVSQKWVNANDAGGHTIENPSGTDMTQRANLQFADAHLTDDSVNDRTEVEIAKEVTEAAFDALNPQGTEHDGVYLMEVDDATPLTADMVGYNGGTVKGALDVSDISSLVTKSASYSFSNESYKKIGNLIVLSFQAEASSSYTSGVLNDIITLDASITPTKNRFASFVGSAIDGTPITIANTILFSSGRKISVVPVSSCKIVAGTFTYALN